MKNDEFLNICDRRSISLYFIQVRSNINIQITPIFRSLIPIFYKQKNAPLIYKFICAMIYHKIIFRTVRSSVQTTKCFCKVSLHCTVILKPKKIIYLNFEGFYFYVRKCFFRKVVKKIHDLHDDLQIIERKIRVRISSTFSVLRPLYFDLLSNLDFLLVEKHRSKYSFGRSKVSGSKYRK